MPPLLARVSPTWIGPLGLLLLAGVWLGESSPDGGDGFRGPYRADERRVVAEGVPREVALLLPEAGPTWPDAARAALAQRIRREWVPIANRLYGTLHAGLGVWLVPPWPFARRRRRRGCCCRVAAGVYGGNASGS